MTHYVTIPKFAADSGYTEAAIRRKMETGVWLQDQVWIRAPDNRILIDVRGYESWVEQARASGQLRQVA